MVIVAAVDRSDRVPVVLEEAETLARAFDDAIHVVYALSQSDFVNLEQTAYEDTGRALPMDEIEAFAERYAAKVAADLTVEHEAVGLVGDPADEIVAYADEVDARYIVVSARKRSPAGKALFGSVTQSVLLNAGRPVVAITSESGGLFE